ncbi:Type IV inositol polyphosphate 5-phosphatase 6 [Glycine max]|nr:Type IV inositol polyphosphate 5-phosphatase 6 [Glycine max]
MTRWHSKAFPSSLLNPSPSPSLSLRFLTSFSPFHFSPSPSLFISSLPLFWFSLLLRIKPATLDVVGGLSSLPTITYENLGGKEKDRKKEGKREGNRIERMVNSLVQECDRILWYGEGLHQLSYVRGESKFSDHRPVYGIFCAEVESTHGRLKKTMSCSRSRIEVEELLPYSGGYTELKILHPPITVQQLVPHYQAGITLKKTHSWREIGTTHFPHTQKVLGYSHALPNT